MSVILHLSDLHLGSTADETEAIVGALPRALARVRESAAEPVSLIAITGDVFDTATIDLSYATETFGGYLRDMRAALGGQVPAIVIPGNHDRRQKGLIGPHRSELFRALRDSAPPLTFVHGTGSPVLGAVVPEALHRLPASIVAYDSSHLPTGLIGAGGMLSQEDLLRVASELLDTPADQPVILLLHHHLVPTPLTDLGTIELPAETFLRWGLQHILPELVANADREELTMTALGAGTALSTLHTLRRAVLVLHGHKHYATARVLGHTVEGHGDLLIVSAGSAGLAEKWSPSGNGDVARLWPSFNVLTLERGELDVTTWSFGYKGSSVGEVSMRPLLRARQDGSRWAVRPVRLETRGRIGPTLKLNESICRLVPSRAHGHDRWDYLNERRIVTDGPSPRRYTENIEGAPDGRLEVLDGNGQVVATHTVPARIELDVRDRTTRYRLDGGVCRTVREAELVYGKRTSPYEWIGLMNRYQCAAVRLSLLGLGNLARDAFASVTDLGTGLEEPAAIDRTGGGDALRLAVANCPARTLLRIYWLLD